MAAEINSFPFKGLTIEVSTGSETEQAFIKFEENGIQKEYYIDGYQTSKSGQKVNVDYLKFIKDSAGNVQNQDIQQSFDATQQESAAYFYNIPADKIGLKTDLMSINGLLFFLKGALCYSPENGNFYPPISIDIETEPSTYTLIFPERTEMPEKPIDPNLPEEMTIRGIQPELKSNYDGRIKIIPVDIIGNPTFRILESNMNEEMISETGEFTELAAGEYNIMVSSDAAEMPSIFTVKIDLIEKKEPEE
jgi:hypothetical protein